MKVHEAELNFMLITTLWDQELLSSSEMSNPTYRQVADVTNVILPESETFEEWAQWHTLVNDPLYLIVISLQQKTFGPFSQFLINIYLFNASFFYHVHNDHDSLRSWLSSATGDPETTWDGNTRQPREKAASSQKQEATPTLVYSNYPELSKRDRLWQPYLKEQHKRLQCTWTLCRRKQSIQSIRDGRHIFLDTSSKWSLRLE